MAQEDTEGEREEEGEGLPLTLLQGLLLGLPVALPAAPEAVRAQLLLRVTLREAVPETDIVLLVVEEGVGAREEAAALAEVLPVKEGEREGEGEAEGLPLGLPDTVRVGEPVKVAQGLGLRVAPVEAVEQRLALTLPVAQAVEERLGGAEVAMAVEVLLRVGEMEGEKLGEPLGEGETAGDRLPEALVEKLRLPVPQRVVVGEVERLRTAEVASGETETERVNLGERDPVAGTVAEARGEGVRVPAASGPPASPPLLLAPTDTVTLGLLL